MKDILKILIAIPFMSIVYADNVETGIYKYIPLIYAVPEGSVGVFYVGAFYDETYPPGIYPLITWPLTRGMLINTRPQIDIIENVSCGTIDGLTIQFPRIAVYNQLHDKYVLDIIKRFGEGYDHFLITEPTIQAVIELCTTMTAQELYIDKFPTLDETLTKHLTEQQKKSESNLEINRVVISKPILPREIQINYETIVVEKSKLTAVTEAQRRILKESETEQKKKSKDAETLKILSRIENEKRIAEESANSEIEKIKVAIKVHKSEKDAETEAYAIKQKGEATAYVLRINGEAKANSTLLEARANLELLTPLYIQKVQAEAFWKNNNSRIIYFGEQIPRSVFPSFIDPKFVPDEN